LRNTDFEAAAALKKQIEKIYLDLEKDPGPTIPPAREVQAEALEVWKTALALRKENTASHLRSARITIGKLIAFAAQRGVTLFEIVPSVTNQGLLGLYIGPSVDVTSNYMFLIHLRVIIGKSAHAEYLRLKQMLPNVAHSDSASDRFQSSIIPVHEFVDQGGFARSTRREYMDFVLELQDLFQDEDDLIDIANTAHSLRSPSVRLIITEELLDSGYDVGRSERGGLTLRLFGRNFSRDPIDFFLTNYVAETSTYSVNYYHKGPVREKKRVDADVGAIERDGAEEFEDEERILES